ncbi:MAG: lipoyl(octanoyl) transferase LipB [Pseudobdellovibrio sp.]
MIFEDWGLIPYQDALEKQLSYVEKLSLSIDKNETHPGYLIFCSHPPVVTTGRQTQLHDIFAWKGEVIEISRGGRATYHGPSQIVVYPILNLKNPRGLKTDSSGKITSESRVAQDIRGYLRSFEAAIVDTLKHYSIEATGKTPQKMPGQQTETDETGVWINQQKIASLGIAVKKWITYHGAAINFTNDPHAFTGINPCGFKTETMVNVEKILEQRQNSTQAPNDTHLFQKSIESLKLEFKESLRQKLQLYL